MQRYHCISCNHICSKQPHEPAYRDRGCRRPSRAHHSDRATIAVADIPGVIGAPRGLHLVHPPA